MLDEDQQTLINFNKDTLLVPRTAVKIANIFNMAQNKILNRNLEKVPHKGWHEQEKVEFIKNVDKFMKMYSSKELRQEDLNLMKAIIS